MNTLEKRSRHWIRITKEVVGLSEGAGGLRTILSVTSFRPLVGLSRRRVVRCEGSGSE